MLYGTGEGLTVPVVPDGTVANSIVPAPQLQVNVTIGGRPAVAQYAGTAPSLVAGALQLNVSIPEGLPAGNAAVVVTVGTTSSRAGVTVAVR